MQQKKFIEKILKLKNENPDEEATEEAAKLIREKTKRVIAVYTYASEEV